LPPTEETELPESPEETDGSGEVDETTTPEEEQPQPLPEPEPQNQSEESSPQPSTTEEAVTQVLESLAPGEAVSVTALAEAGLTYSDLPPETPVEVRQDENGNEVIITAEVAAALVLLENPAELIGAIFSDPGQAIQALANIGADMSPEEREEAEKMVIAAVIAGQAALNAVGIAATATGGTTSGGSTGGGGGSSGGGGASGESGYRRRKP
jgi:uncharacterized membrane protein YgcG